MPDVTLKDIVAFFRAPSETLKEFRDQWSALPDGDKAVLKAGMVDGSLTY